MKTILFLFITLLTFLPTKAQQNDTEQLAREKERKELLKANKEALQKALNNVRPKLVKGNPLLNACLYATEGRELAKAGYTAAANRMMQLSVDQLPEWLDSETLDLGSCGCYENMEAIDVAVKMAEMKAKKISEKESEKEQISRNLDSVKEFYNADLTPQIRNELESIENALRKQKIIKESNIRKMRNQTTLGATNKQQQQPEEELEPEEDLTELYKRIAELKAMIQQELLKKQQEQKQQ